MKPARMAIQVALAAAFIVAALPSRADNYRMINRAKPAEVMLVECAQKPSNPTLSWIRRNCTPMDPQKAGTGPIADVLYSAAGNAGCDEHEVEMDVFVGK